MKGINRSAQLFFLLFFIFSCKAKKETNTQKVLTDMAIQTDDIKLNPDEALIFVKVTKTSTKQNRVEVEATLLNLEKQSFGFNAYLNKNDKVSLYSNKPSISITEGDQYKIVIQSNPGANSFLIIRIIE